MTYDPKIHHRHSLRLKGFDYSQAGMYFITIVTQEREALFGEVVNGEMRLNRYGRIVQAAWFDLPRHYKHVELGALVVMPNHVHGIIIFNDIGRGGSARVSQPAPDKATTSSSSSTIEIEDPPLQKTTRPSRNRPCLQILFRAAHQLFAPCERHSSLAALLLRPHHSQRARS
jgi:hypothetical protein